MNQGKLVKEAGKAFFLSIIVTAVFLVIMAFLMLKTGIGEEIISKLMLIGYIIAPASGGFFLGKKRKQARFLWGMLIGVLYFLVYMFIAVIAMDVPLSELLWVAIPVVLSGMAGGMLS